MRMAAVRATPADIEAFKRGVMIGAMTEKDAMNLLNAVRVGLGYNPIVSGGKLRTRTMLRLRKTMRRRHSRRSTTKFTRYG